jgi:predicted acylesterase/phospholipase RssA
MGSREGTMSFSDVLQHVQTVKENVTTACVNTAQDLERNVQTNVRQFRARSLIAWSLVFGIATFILILDLFFNLDLFNVWAIAFWVLASILIFHRHAKIVQAIECISTHPATWKSLVDRGFTWLAVIVICVGITVFWRIGSPWKATIFAIIYGIAGFLFLTWTLRRETSEAQWLKVLVGAVGPIVIAWVIISTIHGSFLIGEALRGRSHDPEHTQLRAVRTERTGWRDQWDKAQRPGIAVTLSGGGYRAAMAHAGVLWVLDKANIPIHALSTVSGGSIVGAAYALGWPPEDFTKRLCGGTPGLPNMLLNFYPFMAQMLLPWWGSGDTYWLHFYLTYFHNHTLGDTGPPDLIVNATHYERGQRVAFWKDGAALTELARVVAASGAFPVYFEPVSIGAERYMDGGVVENLGLEGLVQYLENMGPRWASRQAPPLLIVSDLSAEPKAPRSWQKPSLLQMAMHSTNVTYQSLHARLFDIYSDGAYGHPLQDPKNEAEKIAAYMVPAGRVWRWTDDKAKVNVLLLRPTAQAERWRFHGDDEARVQAVANLETLKELSPTEIDDTFYVGAKLASDYLPKICGDAGLTSCPTVDLRSVPRCRRR